MITCHPTFSRITYFVLFSRDGDKLELQHTFEGHALGVVSVDMNTEGTSEYPSYDDAHTECDELILPTVIFATSGF